MTSKQKAWLTFLCLLPFIVALGFRAADNYQFSLQQTKLRKEKSDYYPALTTPGWEEAEREYACQRLKMAADSLNMIRADLTE